MFYHEEKKIRVLVRGDDITVLGGSKELDWFREAIQKRMEVKLKGRLERGKPGAVRILKRIVTVTERGLEYEADQRHAEIIVKDLGLLPDCKGVGEPEEDGPEEGGGVDERRYRAIAARANYLAQERVDIQLAAKEISRFISKPEPEDWRKTKMSGRYLEDNLRVVLEYKFQKLPDNVVGHGIRRLQKD